MPDPVPVQTQQQQNAASQAWLAANHPDWNQNAGTPQQAAQTNQAYLNNTLPVLPSMAPNQYGNYSNETFTAYTPSGTPYLVSAAQDAINEQQKYAAFNAPINYGNFANMSLGQIASQYGTTFADRVQGYYTQHPTQNFLDITAQYNQQHQILQNPFPENTAAGIAWEVGRTTGGTGNITESMKTQANVEAKFYGAPANLFSFMPSTSGRETTAPPSLVDYTNPTTGQDMYIRIGNLGDTQLRENAKMIFAPSGGFEILQVVPNNIPGMDFTRVYPWIVAGGSDNSLQGEAVTGSPLVKDVNGNVTKAGVYDAYGNRMWSSLSAEGALWQDIHFNSDAYFKAGREFGGGYVYQKSGSERQAEINNGTLMAIPGEYYAPLNTYAGLVTVQAENAPKGTIASEANLPGFGAISPSQFASMPAVQKVDMQGNLSGGSPTTAITPSWLSSLAAGNMIVVKDTSGVFGAAAPGTFATAHLLLSPEGNVMYEQRTDPFSVVLEGMMFAGDYASFGLLNGKAVIAAKGQNNNLPLEQYNVGIAGLEQGKTANNQLGITITSEKASITAMTSGKINAAGQFTGTFEEYTAYKSAVDKLKGDVATFNAFGERQEGIIQSGLKSGAIIPYEGGYLANPDLDRPYGAFSDWQRGAGQVIQEAFGQKPVTESQFIAFEQTPGFKNAGPIMQFGEGAYKVLATQPATLPAVALQGAEIYAGFGLLNAGLGAAAGSEAFGATVPKIAGAAQTALNSRWFQYGLGTALVAGTAYSATEGFTASPERAFSNFGGSAIRLTAMAWGGYSPEIASAAYRGVFAGSPATESFGNLGGGSRAAPSEQSPWGRDTSGYDNRDWSDFDAQYGRGVGVNPAYSTETPVYQGFADTMSGRQIALTEHLDRGDLANNLVGFNRMMGFENTASTPTVAAPAGGPGYSFLPPAPMRPMSFEDIMASTFREPVVPEGAIKVTDASAYGGISMSRDMAFEYAKVRYPGQGEIWGDYLTKTQMMPREYAEPQMQREVTEARSSLPYKEPIDVNKLNDLFRNSVSSSTAEEHGGLSIRTESEIAPSERYSQIVSMREEDVRAIRRMTETELQAVPKGMQDYARAYSLSAMPQVSVSQDYARSFGTAALVGTALSQKAAPSQDYARAFGLATAPAPAPMAIAQYDYARAFSLSPVTLPFSFPKSQPAQDYSRLFDFAPSPSPSPTPEPKIQTWFTPAPPLPIVPTVFGLPSFGGPGSNPFSRKRRASFRETFMLGLDIAATGRRQKKAKSWASPKKTRSKRKK
jgi:hypothetical protein